MKDKFSYPLVLELCLVRCGRAGPSCAREFFVRFHPKRNHGPNQQQSDAAEKGKRPVSRLIDHISENQRRDYGGQREAGIHQAARWAEDAKEDERTSPRHGYNQPTRGGVKALPSLTSLALKWVIPWANARFSFGVQSLIARVDMGNVAPSSDSSKA